MKKKFAAGPLSRVLLLLKRQELFILISREASSRLKFALSTISRVFIPFLTSKEHAAGERSMAKVKAAGKYRQEGKTYVVKVWNPLSSCLSLGRGYHILPIQPWKRQKVVEQIDLEKKDSTIQLPSVRTLDWLHTNRFPK